MGWFTVLFIAFSPSLSVVCDLLQNNICGLNGCHEPVILYQCLHTNWRLLLTRQSSSVVEFYSWAVGVCWALWWKGNAAHLPSAFTKGHLKSSLCGGTSPCHGVSPSMQLVHVMDCCRQHLFSSPISWARNPDSIRTSHFGPGSRDFVGWWWEECGLCGWGADLELWLQGCRVWWFGRLRDVTLGV